MHRFDLVYLADLRFSGGTTTALMNELAAAQQAGFSIAVQPIQSSTLSIRTPPSPKLFGFLKECGVPIVPPGLRISTPLALIYHPTILNTIPTRKIEIKADTVGIVAHHPLTDADGEPQFRYTEMRDNIRHVFGVEAKVLPVGPKVRDSFKAAGHSADLYSEDWSNLIDVNSWPEVSASTSSKQIVIGRHSRPDPLKWPAPAEAKLAYPKGDGVQYKMLGVDKKLRSNFAPWPDHWSGQPFSTTGVPDFLSGLDVFAYFHNPSWVEAFGYTILEAMAVGLPVVLAPDFEPLFGKAAIYCKPENAGECYDELLQDPKRRSDQGRLARKLAADRFGYGSFGARVERFTGTDERAPKQARSRIIPRRPTKLMAVTSNGVGAGHIVRQIAIAKSSPVGFATNFFSMSKSVRFAAEEGFSAEYRPFHRQTGSDVGRWNEWLRNETIEALAFYQPDAVVFDGNMPYAGLLNAVQAWPDVARIWVRRGMWRHPNKVAQRRADLFHLVITPGEICAPADPGNGASDDITAHDVAPILSLPPSEQLGRQTARRLLDLPAEGEICLLQLGAGANFDMAPAREHALQKLLQNNDRHVVELLSPARMDDVERVSPRHHLRTVFPAFLYGQAFDFSVGAAGYNAFHEAIAGCLPTVFVPNSASEMDLQETRANYAVQAGWGLVARAGDVYALEAAVSQMANNTQLRQEMRDKMKGLDQDWDGAKQAAELINLTAMTVPLLRARVKS